ncbi:hypothetical protein TNCT_725831 [Trichonephila clavata]|uniref:Uncharacterized protein n=1 Tax=Trichonephila clavata TaxID=2740835 RepID=A0A8X6GRQ7_TRICU|nr:hypothetical protein TNCT_725831 [Trichonephila clavata]
MNLLPPLRCCCKGVYLRLFPFSRSVSFNLPIPIPNMKNSSPKTDKQIIELQLRFTSCNIVGKRVCNQICWMTFTLNKRSLAQGSKIMVTKATHLHLYCSKMAYHTAHIHPRDND